MLLRERVTVPVGITKTASGRNSLAIMSESFSFHAETRCSTDAEINLRSSGFCLPACAPPTSFSDSGKKIKKIRPRIPRGRRLRNHVQTAGAAMKLKTEQFECHCASDNVYVLLQARRRTYRAPACESRQSFEGHEPATADHLPRSARRGSRASRSASPSRLKLISAKKINNPGRNTCSGAMKILVAAWVSRLPQLGVGG